MSIRTRLLVTYLALTTLGISLLGLYNLWAFQSYSMYRAETDLEARAQALTESIGDALAAGNLPRVHLLVRRNARQEGINLRIIAPDGRLISSATPQVDRQLADWSRVPGVPEALAGTSNSGVARGVLARGDRLYQARPIRRRGRLLGVLRMSVTLEHFQRQLRNNILTMLATMGLTFALCALVSFWLARGLAAPIQAMRNFALGIGSGHFGEKLEVRRDDELGQLAVELRRMGDRLASLDAERKLFLANVAHELRTPVSNVQVTLEALAEGADEEPELRARFIRSAQVELQRLTRLVQDLLDLGRLEAGVVHLELQPIRLRDLIGQAVAAMESRLRARGLQVRRDVPDLSIQADPERLAQVLMNLLDNAIRYSEPESVVTLSARAGEACVSIQVHDQGSGIREDDLPRVFERFFVADSSRKGSGAGLGLAIARRIVEAHGGTIEAVSASGQGTTFTVRLPLRAGVSQLLRH